MREVLDFFLALADGVMSLLRAFLYFVAFLLLMASIALPVAYVFVARDPFPPVVFFLIMAGALPALVVWIIAVSIRVRRF